MLIVGKVSLSEATGQRETFSASGELSQCPPLSYPAKGYLSNRGFRWPLSPTFPKHSSELPTWEGHPRTKDGGRAPKLDGVQFEFSGYHTVELLYASVSLRSDCEEENYLVTEGRCQGNREQGGESEGVIGSTMRGLAQRRCMDGSHGSPEPVRGEEPTQVLVSNGWARNLSEVL